MRHSLIVVIITEMVKRAIKITGSSIVSTCPILIRTRPASDKAKIKLSALLMAKIGFIKMLGGRLAFIANISQPTLNRVIIEDINMLIEVERLTILSGTHVWKFIRNLMLS